MSTPAKPPVWLNDLDILVYGQPSADRSHLHIEMNQAHLQEYREYLKASGGNEADALYPSFRGLPVRLNNERETPALIDGRYVRPRDG